MGTISFNIQHSGGIGLKSVLSLIQAQPRQFSCISLGFVTRDQHAIFLPKRTSLNPDDLVSSNRLAPGELKARGMCLTSIRSPRLVTEADILERQSELASTATLVGLFQIELVVLCGSQSRQRRALRIVDRRTTPVNYHILCWFQQICFDGIEVLTDLDFHGAPYLEKDNASWLDGAADLEANVGRMEKLCVALSNALPNFQSLPRIKIEKVELTQRDRRRLRRMPVQWG